MTRVPFALTSLLTPTPVLDEWETDEFRPEPLLEMAHATRRRRPRVVITGLSALAPNGNTAEEFWANCLAGVGGIGPITRFDASAYTTHFAAEVKNFEPKDFMDFKEARRMSRTSQFIVACCQQAAADARLELAGYAYRWFTLG